MSSEKEAVEKIDALIQKYERIIRDCVDEASRTLGGPAWTTLRSQADACVCVSNDLRELRASLRTE